jgi:hypothetical protein
MYDVVFVTRYQDYQSFCLAQETIATGLDGIGRLFAVIPDGEQALFARVPLHTTLIAESALDRRLAELPPSWFKQQLLKLCTHRFLEHSAALILDSDTYLCRPAVAAELLAEDGQIAFFVEDEGGTIHPGWREAAEVLLGRRSTAGWSFFPTPNFVHVQALRALHTYLAERWGGDALDGLVARLGEYTEWATYGLFIHEVMPRPCPQVFRPANHVLGIWDRADFDAWDPTGRHAPSRMPPLLIVQSSMALPWPAVAKRLELYPYIAGCLRATQAHHA